MGDSPEVVRGQPNERPARRIAPQPPPLRPLEPTEIADSAIAARAVLRDASRAVEATTDLAGIDEGLDALGAPPDSERS